MDKREMRERVRISYFFSFILAHVFVRGGEKQLTHEALFGDNCLAKKQLTTVHEAVVSCAK
jgi:hypothetical protein